MSIPFFVYGTLKRGQCREALWPRPPQRIRTGFVRGWLFDLGSYPAMWCGECEPFETPRDHSPADSASKLAVAHPCDCDCDWIAGEIWSIETCDLDVTLKTLDEIEGTNQPGELNLYDQILVRAYSSPGSHDSVLALAYQYSRLSSLKETIRIRPRAEIHVTWPS